MSTTWTFHAAGQLLFGRGAADQLDDCAGRLGARRVLRVNPRNVTVEDPLSVLESAL